MSLCYYPSLSGSISIPYTEDPDYWEGYKTNEDEH